MQLYVVNSEEELTNITKTFLKAYGREKLRKSIEVDEWYERVLIRMHLLEENPLVAVMPLSFKDENRDEVIRKGRELYERLEIPELTPENEEKIKKSPFRQLYS